MSKTQAIRKFAPPQVRQELIRLGESIALARIRRKESQSEWALRIGISPPTLARMEKGDPTVSVGVYATALWLIGKVGELGSIASPEKDTGAIEKDVRAARIRKENLARRGKRADRAIGKSNEK